MAKGVGRKISRGGGATKKKDRKISTIKLLPGRGQRKKDPQVEKTPKNSTFKPLYTILVPCMKIQGDHGHLPPAADAHAYGTKFSYLLVRDLSCVIYTCK